MQSQAVRYLVLYPQAASRLVRLPNLFIMAVTQFCVAVFLIGPKEEWLSYYLDPRLHLLIVSTVLIAAAGYVINDYYDVKIDIINKPHRLIVGRTLPRRHAMFVHLILNMAGLGISFMLGLEVAAIHFCAIILLWWYSNFLKRLPLTGNLIVAFLTGLTVFMVGYIYRVPYSHLILAYSSLAFLLSLIREIIKDIEDVKGDRNFGCDTLPIRYGIRSAKKVVYLVELLLLGAMIFTGSRYNPLLLAIYGIFVVCPLILFTVMLVRADTRKDFKFLSLLAKLIMICGVASMIFT